MANFTRAQNVLRSYFGLGPVQLETERFILPVLDVQHLTVSNQEQEIIEGATAPQNPGLTGSFTLPWPRSGYWAVDQVSFDTVGPATSGLFGMWPMIEWIRSGKTSRFFIDPSLRSAQAMTRLSATLQQGMGFMFRPPLVLFALPPAIQDRFVMGWSTDGAAVGTTTFNIRCLARCLELVKEGGV